MATSKPYAAGTTVPATKSQEDIEKTLARYGATKFGLIKDDEERSFAVAFQIPPASADGHKIRVRFTVFLPTEEELSKVKVSSSASSTGTRKRTATQIAAAAEAENRRLWRSLAMGIKAKLVLVDDGIETVEQALYAHIVNPATQRTVYEETHEQVAESYKQIGPRRGVFQIEAAAATDK